MEEFAANEKRSKEIAGIGRKNSKRWKIGRWIGILLIAIAVITPVSCGMSMDGEDTFGSIMFSLIYSVPILIAAFIVFGAAASGGYDNMLIRADEKVYLDTTQLRNVFTPRNKQNINADSVEINVSYESIKEMLWNAVLCRLEITAEYKYIERKQGFPKVKVITDNPVILYGYFDSMEKMLDLLETYTNKKITGRIE